MTQQQQFAEILYRALREPVGLLLRSSAPTQARAKLYAARREAGDPELSQLQIRMSPLSGGDIILVKEKIQLELAP